jgi:dihydroorotate dehydrogenase electron transfer subunit
MGHHNKRLNESLVIRENSQICPGYYRVALDAENLARAARPGQFCMLKIAGAYLRRPLSIYSVSGSKVEFLYKTVGKGTELLSALLPGAKIEVLGPLGNGYRLEDVSGDRLPLLIAGGTGIASLNFLAEKLHKPGILFYGAKNRTELVCLDNFRKLGWKMELATDDGSAGYKGVVTDLFENYLAGKDIANDVLYACGPVAMLVKSTQIAKDFELKGFVSLEEKMACGVGNCQGCAVRSGESYKMVCKDGPVFRIEEIF